MIIPTIRCFLRIDSLTQVLHLEQSCKASEMSMLEAEVDAAELNMKSQALKSLLEEASGHAVEVTENTAASAGSRGIGDEDYDDIDSKYVPRLDVYLGCGNEWRPIVACTMACTMLEAVFLHEL